MPDEPAVDERLAPVLSALGWAVARAEVRALAGGRLDGDVVRVAVPRQRPVVVRLAPATAGPVPVDRAAEAADARAAAAAGCGPAVVAHLPELGALVLEWVPGRPLTPTDLRDLPTLRRVGQVVARLQAAGRFAADRDVGSTLAAYVAQADRRGLAAPPGTADLVPPVARVLEALAARPERAVPCHGDLVAGNVVDDGSRLWLVDLEYAANSDPCLDLGTLWAAADLDEPQLAALVAARFGQPSQERVARSRLLGALTSYTWVLWAALHVVDGAADRDYRRLGADSLRVARRELTGPDLDRLLAVVRAG